MIGEREKLVTIQLRAFRAFGYGAPIRRCLVFSACWLDRRSANGREGALCSLCFRYSRRCRVKIWNQDEGVLVTRVAATHEARFGPPAGTFGAHRGADLKHQVPPQVFRGSVAVFERVFQESCKIHRSLWSLCSFTDCFRSSSSFRCWSLRSSTVARGLLVVFSVFTDRFSVQLSFRRLFFSSVQFPSFFLILIGFYRLFPSFLSCYRSFAIPFVFHRKICQEPPLQLEEFQETVRNEDNKAKFDACWEWRYDHATGHGDDAGPVGGDGRIKSRARAHAGGSRGVTGEEWRVMPYEWGVALRVAQPLRATRSRWSWMLHATKGVLHTVLTVDHGGGDPSHVRRS